MAHSATADEYSQVSLRSLKLRAGMFLQAEGVGEDARNYEMQYVGVIEDKCLMLMPVGFASLKFGMQAGETYILRGFTGQHDFRFGVTVIQAFDFTFRTPAYAYAVLSYPETVEAKQVRKAMRIKTSLPADATPHGAAIPDPVTVVDLSVDGALLHSAAELGAAGELVRVDFSLDPDKLLTLARICHSHRGEGGFFTGVLFENISAAARVALKEFVLSNLE